MEPSSTCDFCGGSVDGDETQVGIIKGADALADFETRLGKRHQQPPVRVDPQDGAPLYLACPMCLLKSAGVCSKCGEESDSLMASIIRGDSGSEVPALLCYKCVAKLMMEGGTFGGIR